MIGWNSSDYAKSLYEMAKVPDDDFVEWTHDKINDIMSSTVGTKTDKAVGASGNEAIGSIKSVTHADGTTKIYRKQKNGNWAITDSQADRWDLTDDEEDGNISPMDTKKPIKSALIPNADAYLDNHFNVLLIALHGVGKTVSIMDLARQRGLKFKYYSCSTLDPYTDLVGVPTPRDYCPECKTYFKDQPKCPDCGGKTVESLKMVRPREVDEAEIIFFDEFNRADSKTQNALFEIMQFKSINGEPLPNLKACWAAINPPDDEQNYQVEQIDPALLDRFDLFIDLVPKPSVAYMEQHMPKPIAAALWSWWNEHQVAIKNGTKDAHSDYISPRRLEKIGLVWCATKNKRSVYAAIPTGVQAERRKLTDLLERAQAEVNKANGVDEPVVVEDDDDDLSGANIGDRPAPQFTYRLSSMRLQQGELSEYLKDNPLHLPTHEKVAEQLRTGVGGEEMVLKYGELLDAINPSLLESLVTGFPMPKVNEMRKGFKALYASDANHTSKLMSLYKVLSTGVTNDPDWPNI